MHQFKLRFPASQIIELANEQVSELSSTVKKKEEFIDKEIKNFVKQNGFLSREHFLKVCNWKSPRPIKSHEKNDEKFIEEVSRYALNATHERLRIELWRTMSGVDWRMASVFLHWFHNDRYPILDFRALWSLSSEAKYNFNIWIDYTHFCRELANKSDVDMRTLDRALWQYSKKNQLSSVF